MAEGRAEEVYLRVQRRFARLWPPSSVLDIVLVLQLMCRAVPGSCRGSTREEDLKFGVWIP